MFTALLVCCVMLVAAQSAYAEDPLYGSKRTLDPRAVGTAGALRASPSGVSGIYLNPATIAMANLYHMNMMYQYTGEENMHMGGAAIVDSVTSSTVAVGLALNYLGANLNTTHHESWDARMALGGNLGDVFFIGLTGRYIRVEHDLENGDRGPESMPPALPASGSRQLDGFTFDAGAAIKIANLLSIGVTGYNLTNTQSVYAPLQLGGGVGTTFFNILQIEADLVFDFSTHEETSQEINLGAELFVANTLPLRVGYIYDAYYDLNTIAAGIGYSDSSFALDIGFQYELNDSGRFFLAFGLRIFMS